MTISGFSGAVLTGGASSRMGRDKSLLKINGRALASIAAAALRDAGAAEVMVVGGHIGELLRLPEIEKGIPDRFPGEGPLGGILSALHAARHDVVVVLACDTPEVDHRTPELLLEALSADPYAAVAYAMNDGRPQPLTAAWRKSRALPTLDQLFESGERAPRSAFSLLPAIEVAAVPSNAVADVDNPRDLERYAAEASKASNTNED